MRWTAVVIGLVLACSTFAQAMAQPRCHVGGRAGTVLVSVDIRNDDAGYTSQIFGGLVPVPPEAFAQTPEFGFRVSDSAGPKRAGAMWRCDTSQRPTPGQWNCRDGRARGVVQLSAAILNPDGSGHWNKGAPWSTVPPGGSVVTDPFEFQHGSGAQASQGTKRVGATWACK